MIYLDYQATTPLAPEAAEAMRPWLEAQYGNPHSSHRMGRQAAAAVEVAREQVLTAFRTQPSTNALPPRSSRAKSRGAWDEVGAAPLDPSTSLRGAYARDERGLLYFTSGATEAANWALKGAAARLPHNRRKIVTLATEHAATLDTVRWLATQGYEADILPVRSDGVADLDLLAARIDQSTGLVAVMLVNNEIGVIQPVEAIARLAQAQGALFFCDAVQALGRVPIPLHACDMVAVSAHKVHGPKGIGALWVREGTPLDPLLHGGGQEGGLRSGTLSPALCTGFGAAARLLTDRAEEDSAHIARLWNIATEMLSGWTINGSITARYRGNLNIRHDGLDSARLISELRQVAFSSGSACASGSGRPSHVLSALGLSDRDARASIRLGFGRYTSEDDLRTALTAINAAAARQRTFAA